MITPARVVLAGCICVLGLCGGLRAATPPQRLAHFEAMGKPAVLPDGTLALYFVDIRGPGLAPTPATQELRCRTSSDNGRTWSDYQSLLTFPAEEGGFGFHCVLVDRMGEVHLFLLCDANTGIIRARQPAEGRPAVEPLARQRLDIWHVRSTDQRTKWTQPRRIWEGRGGDLQSVIQLRDARIVLPICYVVGRSWRDRGEGFNAFTYMGQFDCTVLYSDDQGATWQKSGSVLRAPTPHIGGNGAVEPVVVQLNDGRVWMLLRTQNGRFYESFSHDGAEWSPARPTPILSSDSPAGLVRLSDGRLVLLWNNCQRFPYAQGARNVLHAAISDDDGRTWRGYREIMRDPHRNDPPPPGGDHGVAYPYPVQAPDGRIVYTMWVQSGQGRSVEAFDPQWLLETSDGDDFSKGLDRWSVFGTKGAQVVMERDSADGYVLSLKKTDADWPCAAVWNFPCTPSGKLKMRVQIQPPFTGATLMLTDHFSVPFDAQDEFHSVYRIPIATDSRSSGAIPGGRWIDLELRWDADGRACRLFIDGQASVMLPQQRQSPGPSYLRIKCDALEPEPGRLLIDSVQISADGD